MKKLPFFTSNSDLFKKIKTLSLFSQREKIKISLNKNIAKRISPSQGKKFRVNLKIKL